MAESSYSEQAPRSDLQELQELFNKSGISEVTRLLYDHIKKNPRHMPIIAPVVSWTHDFYEPREVLEQIINNPFLRDLQDEKTLDNKPVLQPQRLMNDDPRTGEQVEEIGIIIAEPKYPSLHTAIHEGTQALDEWDGFYVGVSKRGIRAGMIDYNALRNNNETTPAKIEFVKEKVGNSAIDRSWNYSLADFLKWGENGRERVLDGAIDAYNASMGRNRPFSLKNSDSPAPVIDFQARKAARK